MFARLRARIRALIQLPSQLSTVRTLVEHLISLQRETNDLLRESMTRTGNLPATPPTPMLDLADLPPLLSSADSPPKLPSRRLRTAADVVRADRQHLLDEQEKRRIADAQADRDGQRIV